ARSRRRWRDRHPVRGRGLWCVRHGRSLAGARPGFPTPSRRGGTVTGRVSALGSRPRHPRQLVSRAGAPAPAGAGGLPSAVPDLRRGRSFSSDPRRLSPLTPAQLERLERCEAAMTARLLPVLDAEADVAAVVSRVGSGLSRRRFGGDGSGCTHIGPAARGGGGGGVRQLLFRSLFSAL